MFIWPIFFLLFSISINVVHSQQQKPTTTAPKTNKQTNKKEKSKKKEGGKITPPKQESPHKLTPEEIDNKPQIQVANENHVSFHPDYSMVINGSKSLEMAIFKNFYERWHVILWSKDKIQISEFKHPIFKDLKIQALDAFQIISFKFDSNSLQPKIEKKDDLYVIKFFDFERIDFKEIKLATIPLHGEAEPLYLYDFETNENYVVYTSILPSEGYNEQFLSFGRSLKSYQGLILNFPREDDEISHRREEESISVKGEFSIKSVNNFPNSLFDFYEKHLQDRKEKLKGKDYSGIDDLVKIAWLNLLDNDTVPTYNNLGHLQIKYPLIKTEPIHKILFATAELMGKHYSKAIPLLKDIPSEEAGSLYAFATKNGDKLRGIKNPQFLAAYPERMRSRIIFPMLLKLVRDKKNASLVKTYLTDDFRPSSMQELLMFQLIKAKSKIIDGDYSPQMIESLSDIIKKSPKLSEIANLAEFELVKLLLQRKELTIQDSIPRLQRVLYTRFNSDDLYDVSFFLAIQYLAVKEYSQAFRLFQKLMRLDPLKSEEDTIPVRLKAEFINYFTGPASTKPPLENILFFEEFKPYCPNDQHEGPIINLISKNLVELNLYDAASNLLNKKLETLDPNTPYFNDIVLKIIDINVMNKNVPSTQSAMERLNFSKLTKEQQDLLRYYEAKIAYIEGHFQAVISKLEGPNSLEGDILKLNSLFKLKEWKQCITQAESFINHKDIKAYEREQTLLQVLFAYYQLKDFEALKQTVKKYENEISKSPILKKLSLISQANTLQEIENNATLTEYLNGLTSLIKDIDDKKDKKESKQAGPPGK